MTMESLAILVGTSRQTIQRYESGRISRPPYERIEALAAALGITPGELMGWQGEEESERGSDGEDLPFVTVGDDAMVADRILERDAVYYYPSLTVAEGQINVVSLNGEPLVRRVWIHGNSLLLVASNPTFPPIVAERDAPHVRILGTAAYLKTSL